jgi:hypothetical protein
VFAPLWMSYLSYPMTFLNHLRDARSTSTAQQLAHILGALDWKRIFLDYQSREEPTLFEGDVPVLLITNAGSESLDLKGVRHIVFLDSVWTPASENQIVGRAQRYNSHADLPPGERTVNVWKLRLSQGSGNQKSAEERIAQIVQRKQGEAEDVYRIVKKVSI